MVRVPGLDRDPAAIESQGFAHVEYGRLVEVSASADMESVFNDFTGCPSMWTAGRGRPAKSNEI